MEASRRSTATSKFMERSARKWKYVEEIGTERSSLEASAEVLLEASTEASLGSTRGSF